MSGLNCFGSVRDMVGGCRKGNEDLAGDLRVTWRERCANVGHVAGASSDRNHESNITTDRSCILAKEKCAAKIAIDKSPKKKKKKKGRDKEDNQER